MGRCDEQYAQEPGHREGRAIQQVQCQKTATRLANCIASEMVSITGRRRKTDVKGAAVDRRPATKGVSAASRARARRIRLWDSPKSGGTACGSSDPERHAWHHYRMCGQIAHLTLPQSLWRVAQPIFTLPEQHVGLEGSPVLIAVTSVAADTLKAVLTQPRDQVIG
jgi:hypothetical protein